MASQTRLDRHPTDSFPQLYRVMTGLNINTRHHVVAPVVTSILSSLILSFVILHVVGACFDFFSETEGI